MVSSYTHRNAETSPPVHASTCPRRARQGLALQHVLEAPAEQKDLHRRVPGTSGWRDQWISGPVSGEFLLETLHLAIRSNMASWKIPELNGIL
jgi:hypothetical protein